MFKLSLRISKDFQRKKPNDFLQLSLRLDVMNNEFAVISFKEKQRKRSIQTWESKHCDSIRNHVERIHFFKNKIKEQLKILIFFHRCLIKKA